MKGQRILILKAILLALIIIVIASSIFYIGNLRDVRLGNVHISSGGDLLAYEMVFLDKEKGIGYLIGVFDIKTGKKEIVYSQHLAATSKSMTLLGFEKDKDGLIIGRGEPIWASDSILSIPEIIHLSLDARGASSDNQKSKEEEQVYGLPGKKGVKLALEQVCVNKPAKLVNLANNTEVGEKDLPDRIDFGKCATIRFTEDSGASRPYYLIFAETFPKGLMIKESSLEPTIVNLKGQEETTEDKRAENIMKAPVFYYNPQEKYLAQIAILSEPLNKAIENIVVFPTKEHILLMSGFNVKLIKLSPLEIVKAFHLKPEIYVEQHRQIYPFRQQIVCAGKEESSFFITNGEKIIEYIIDKKSEWTLCQVRKGIIHSLDLAGDGRTIVAEWYDSGKNKICTISAGGEIKPLATDGKMFIYPGLFKNE